MTANLLQNAGLNLGATLLPAGESNPYGHFEDAEIVGFHDRLLKARGLSWQAERPFLAHVSKNQWSWMNRYVIEREADPLWGFKDPRLCLFVHPWKRILPHAKILYVHRPASECLHSLKRRSARELLQKKDGAGLHIRFWQELDLAARVYLCYAKMFLVAAKRYPRDVAFVSRASIIAGYDLPAALNRLWELDLGEADINDVFDPNVTDTASGCTYISDPALLKSISQVSGRVEEQLLEQTF